MREAFEAWYGEPCVRDGDGYLLCVVQRAWAAWQAAVAWEREECAKVADADWAWADCAAAIRARGEK